MSRAKTRLISSYVEQFNAADLEEPGLTIPNASALAWLVENIPFFTCPDQELERTYYFRWWLFRKHLQKTPVGTIITEFLPEVAWAGPYNSINAALGHHLAEARWLKNSPQWLPDLIRFWFTGSGHVHSYSSWAAAAFFASCQLSGDYTLAVELLPALVRYYETIEKAQLGRHGLFWSNDDRDAMEYSISGCGLRPTLNSYMYGNALAISQTARLAGRSALASQYAKKAALLRQKINQLLWDEKDFFYKVLPLAGKDDQLPARRPASKDVRELLGYIPWEFALPSSSQAAAWRYLTDSSCFFAPYGLTTADQSHPRFMYAASHNCLWNGPVWPFASSQTISSAIRHLQEGGQGLSKHDFYLLISSYAKSHRLILPGQKKDLMWLDENMHPYTGSWLARQIRQDQGGPALGKDYNHSCFADLVLRGLVGLKLLNNSLSLDPLLPAQAWDHFFVDDIYWQGKKITIQYDRLGKKTSQPGLFVLIDGKLAASRPDLGPLSLD